MGPAGKGLPEMNDYILSCCSTADISAELFKERDIHFICFHFEIDGVEYPDDLGQSISFHEFYDRMAAGAMTKTSQVSVGEFEAYFEGFLKEGKDILHLTLSSGISGVLNSALIARDIVSERYPERKVIVLDSLSASCGYGLLMDLLADQRDAGKTIEEVAAYAESMRLRIHHWFFTSDLTYLIRGGRVSKAAGALGKAFKICPLMNVASDGTLQVREKIRTKKKVIQKTVEKMAELAENGTEYNGKCFIAHAACPEDAQAVADLVEETIPHMKGKVEIFSIGTTIGSHTGPGTVVLTFVGAERDN